MTAGKRRIDACLKACEGISTQNLEDNVPFLELARRYNVVLCERDALRAALQHEADCVEAAKAEIKALRARIEEMEKQESVFWWRPCSDGTYEGPLHNNSIERVRKQSGAWSPLYALPGAQQCKNCNGMGDRFDPSGEKIPCDLCESHLEEIRSLVAEAVHDIISGSDFWLSISLAAKKIYALPGAQGEEK